VSKVSEELKEAAEELKKALKAIESTVTKRGQTIEKLSQGLKDYASGLVDRADSRLVQAFNNHNWAVDAKVEGVKNDVEILVHDAIDGAYDTLQEAKGDLDLLGREICGLVDQAIGEAWGLAYSTIFAELQTVSSSLTNMATGLLAKTDRLVEEVKANIETARDNLVTLGLEATSGAELDLSGVSSALQGYLKGMIEAAGDYFSPLTTALDLLWGKADPKLDSLFLFDPDQVVQWQKQIYEAAKKHYLGE